MEISACSTMNCVFVDDERPPGKLFDLRFSPDGKLLAGGAWFELFVWASATGHCRSGLLRTAAKLCPWITALMGGSWQLSGKY